MNAFRNTRALGILLLGVQLAFLGAYLIFPGTDTTTEDSFLDTLFDMVELRSRFVTGYLLLLVGSVGLAVFVASSLSALRQRVDSWQSSVSVLLLLSGTLIISGACVGLAVVDGAEIALSSTSRRQEANAEWLRSLAATSDYLGTSGVCALAAAVVLFGCAALRAKTYGFLRGLPAIIGGSLLFGAESFALIGGYNTPADVSLVAAVGAFVVLAWSLGVTLTLFGVDAAEEAALLSRRARAVTLDRLASRRGPSAN